MKKYISFVALLLLTIAISACSTKNEVGETKAPVFLVISQIVQEYSPFGDIITSDGKLLDETVSVEFLNQVKNPNVYATDPLTQSRYTDIVIKSYRISYSRTDSGHAAPDGFDEAVNIHVPTNGFSIANGVIILHAHQKLQPPISFLQPYNLGFEPSTNYTAIKCRALLEFSGESLAGDKVYASGSIEITFTDYAD